MKQARKAISILTILALLALVTACTSQQPDGISGSNGTPAGQVTTTIEPNISGEPSDTSSNASGNVSGALKTFVLTGDKFKFIQDGQENPDIVVNKGDRVKIELTSVDMTHDWVVDELDARTARAAAGQTVSVEFVADKTGTFEYYCSVGQHRQAGMRGSLIVK